ncbi:Mbeg1-like protein [Pediococcus siamensis]|uniref:Mbeg1-like protein n=1 Tax=Pediococcus siamensis TaxID=381829 RepID=UPI0039A1BF1F
MLDLLTYLDNYNRPVTANLNVADQMLLSRLPFLPLTGIVPADLTSSVALPDALHLLSHQQTDNSKKLLLPNDAQLIQKLSRSFRYAKVRLSGFQVAPPANLLTPYAAITVQLNSENKVVVFRGAEGTTLGWRADLQTLAQAKNRPWQNFAQTYLETVATANHAQLQLVGFSLGGSMAIYAACQVTAAIQQRLCAVVNLDGPQTFLTRPISDPFKTHFQTYLPQLPFFGLGSQYMNLPNIVASTASGVWQHDLYSWQIHDNQPFILGRAATDTAFFKNSLQPWLSEQPVEVVHEFIRTFEAILNASQAVSVNDLLKHWQQVTKAFSTQSTTWTPEARQMGQQTLQAALKIIGSFTRF